MKKYCYIISVLVIILSTNTSRALDYKIPVSNTKDGKLTLIDFTNDLPIEGYNGTEIIITSDQEEDLPERAKGLKPIYSSGIDNTGLGLNIEKNGNQITIRCLLSFAKNGEYKIKVPENFSLKIESGCERSNELEIKNIKNEIEIKNCHSITLHDVTGPLVISTISGNIDVRFSEINKDKPFSLSSISGDIDISLPVKTAANIEMKTLSGTVYSDFDFTMEDKDMKQIGGATSKYKLNGGGIEFYLQSISGNIYVRKGK